MKKSESPSSDSFSADHYDRFSSQNRSQWHINKFLCIFFVIVAIVAIVAVGLGVYFGTRGSNCPASETSKPSSPSTTSISRHTLSTSMSTTSRPPPNIAAYRLPKSLLPTTYYLTIQPYFPSPAVNYPTNKNFTFDGKVEMVFLCTKSTFNITIHMDSILLSSYELLSENQNTPLPITAIQYINETQMVTFTSSVMIQEGQNYRLKLSYTGILRRDLAGFYITAYKENGETK